MKKKNKDCLGQRDGALDPVTTIIIVYSLATASQNMPTIRARGHACMHACMRIRVQRRNCTCEWVGRRVGATSKEVERGSKKKKRANK